VKIPKRLKCRYCDYTTPAGRLHPKCALNLHMRWKHGEWKKGRTKN